MPPPNKRRTATEIAAHYRRLIQDGTLAPGDQLPSRRKITEETGAASGTIDQAFKTLTTEGLLEANSTGTFVAAQSDIAVTGAARFGRRERTGQLRAPGETTSHHWSGLRSVADPVIAKLLDLEPHEEVVIRRRVHHREGSPSTVDSSFIHVRALGVVPEMLEDGPSERWWQERYTERTGRDINRSPERRTARLISNDELNALGIELPPESAASVLVVVNVFHDEDGPLEVWEDVYPPGAWQVDAE